jgi:hypothetical protein
MRTGATLKAIAGRLVQVGDRKVSAIRTDARSGSFTSLE